MTIEYNSSGLYVTSVFEVLELCACYICTMNYKNTVTYNVLYLSKQLYL